MFDRIKNAKWFPLLLVFGLLISACQASPAASGTSADQLRTISVSGTGQISLDPTLARITIGVRTESENAQDAVAENNQLIEDVIATLQDSGVAEEDIQTSNFSIRQEEPQQKLESSTESAAGLYIVNNSLQVTVRDLDQLGSILDEAIQAGANAIRSIQFDAENKEEANKNALELALKDARARAETIADSTGVELGQVHSIETFGGGPVYTERLEAETESAAVPISPGQLDIQVSVNVRYQIQE